MFETPISIKELIVVTGHHHKTMSDLYSEAAAGLQLSTGINKSQQFNTVL
jgi:hypothetical protein